MIDFNVTELKKHIIPLYYIPFKISKIDHYKKSIIHPYIPLKVILILNRICKLYNLKLKFFNNLYCSGTYNYYNKMIKLKSNTKSITYLIHIFCHELAHHIHLTNKKYKISKLSDNDRQCYICLKEYIACKLGFYICQNYFYKKTKYSDHVRWRDKLTKNLHKYQRKNK